MATPKYNKFSTGRTKGYFPLKRWRFNTENHPVIQSKEKCASSTAKTLFSTQELQMLVGLTNTFQCKEREALRIALHECVKNASKANELAFRYAEPKQQIKHIRDDPQRSSGSSLSQKKKKRFNLQSN